MMFTFTKRSLVFTAGAFLSVSFDIPGRMNLPRAHLTSSLVAVSEGKGGRQFPGPGVVNVHPTDIRNVIPE